MHRLSSDQVEAEGVLIFTKSAKIAFLPSIPTVDMLALLISLHSRPIGQHQRHSLVSETYAKIFRPLKRKVEQIINERTQGIGLGFGLRDSCVRLKRLFPARAVCNACGN